MMQRSKAWLLVTHPYRFKSGKAADILGVEWIVPDGFEGRACFHLRWEDGSEDFIPISETSSYTILPETIMRQ